MINPVINSDVVYSSWWSSLHEGAVSDFRKERYTEGTVDESRRVACVYVHGAENVSSLGGFTLLTGCCVVVGNKDKLNPVTFNWNWGAD